MRIEEQLNIIEGGGKENKFSCQNMGQCRSSYGETLQYAPLRRFLGWIDKRFNGPKWQRALFCYGQAGGSDRVVNGAKLDLITRKGNRELLWRDG